MTLENVQKSKYNSNLKILHVLLLYISPSAAFNLDVTSFFRSALLFLIVSLGGDGNTTDSFGDFDVSSFCEKHLKTALEHIVTYL